MRGEWIEIGTAPTTGTFSRSLPMRGEWIEISRVSKRVAPPRGLSPCGESGLKWPRGGSLQRHRGLSPCGESGLKSRQAQGAGKGSASLPMRGEWIEMAARWKPTTASRVSPHAGESGLKFHRAGVAHVGHVGSLPMRGEWIEIPST